VKLKDKLSIIKSLLKDKNVILLLIAQFFFSLAQSYGWTSGVLEAIEKQSTIAVFLIRSVSIALLNLTVGVTVDLLRPRRVGTITTAFLSVVILLLSFLPQTAIFINLTPIMLAGILLEILGPFFDISTEAIIPEISGMKGKLPALSSLVVWSYTIPELIGPIFAQLTHSFALPINAVLIVISCISWTLIKTEHKRTKKQASSHRHEGFFQSIFTGLKYISKSPQLRVVLAAYIPFSINTQNLSFLLTLISKKFNLPYGILYSALIFAWLIGANVVEFSSTHKRMVNFLEKLGVWNFLLWSSFLICYLSNLKFESLMFFYTSTILASAMYISFWTVIQRSTTNVMRARVISMTEALQHTSASFSLTLLKSLLIKIVPLVAFVGMFSIFSMNLNPSCKSKLRN